MPTDHTTDEGECLSSLSEAYGFRDFRHIYDDPANAALRSKRPNPNQLHPGDVVTIPDKQGKQSPAATGQTLHVVQIGKNEARLRVVLQDNNARPLPDVTFTLDFGRDAPGVTGTTTGGLLDAAIPPEATKVKMTLFLPGDPDGASWFCTLGDLRPMSDDLPGDNLGIYGAKARLRNLGFYRGQLDEQLDASFADAVRAFRASHGLTGNVFDSQTRALLERDHDK